MLLFRARDAAACRQTSILMNIPLITTVRARRGILHIFACGKRGHHKIFLNNLR